MKSLMKIPGTINTLAKILIPGALIVGVLLLGSCSAEPKKITLAEAAQTYSATLDSTIKELQAFLKVLPGRLDDVDGKIKKINDRIDVLEANINTLEKAKGN